MEVPDARRVFTTFEQPDLKSVFTFTRDRAGALEGRLQLARPRARAGRATASSVWRFPTTERMSTYVTAVVAGEYHEVRDTYVGKHGEIPLGHYCRQSMAPYLDVDELVEVTKQGFAFFEDAFDFPYPFHKYDQLYVPEFNNGAMENAGCVTLRDEYLPRSRQAALVLRAARQHRAARDGAHVVRRPGDHAAGGTTCGSTSRSPSGPPTTRCVSATSYAEAWTGFTNNRKNWAYRQDQLPTTHPIAADNHDLEAVEVNFDGITYAKGASALKQLVAWVGEGEFLAGLRAYFAPARLRQLASSPTCSRALEETSGPRPRPRGPRSGCRPAASTR